MEIMKSRPPFVMFETRALPDRAATEKAGVMQYKNVNFALITPAGSKDVVEKIADEWFLQIKKQAMEGNYPAEWVPYFELRYAEWKKGNEMPDNGTPLKMWPVATPADIAVLHAAKIFTVEDLAALPESGFQAIGMGARVLREKAQAWLGSGDKGKHAEQITALQVQVRELTQALEREIQKRAELEIELKGRKKAA